MKRLNAVLFAFMMATLSLAGCFGGDDDGDSDDGPTETLDDWTVYMVDSGDDLPNCNSDTLGRLYYVANVETFEVCLTTGWSFIDIKGADGAQGPAGDQGPQGVLELLVRKDQSERLDHKVETLVWTAKQQMRQ